MTTSSVPSPAAADARATPSPVPSGVAWLPFLAAAAGAVLDLPHRLSFHMFMLWDDGGNIAATWMALHGFVAQRDFGFVYGPLTLALQELFVTLVRNAPWGVTWLSILATFAFAAAMREAILRLRLALPAASLLTVAAAVAAYCNQSLPIYALEPAALAWTLVSWAGGRRGAALAGCVAAALIKPTMGVVLGGFFLAGALARIHHRREFGEPAATHAPAWGSWGPHAGACVSGARGARVRARSQPGPVAAPGPAPKLWLPPLATAAVLVPALWGALGTRTFLNLALPLGGVRDYRAMHYSFFRADNPYLLSARDWLTFPGSLRFLWALGLLALTAAVLFFLPRQRALPESQAARVQAATAACAGCWCFLFFFYAWSGSYFYYLTLPLLTLAMLPWDEVGLPARRICGTLALLAVLAMSAATRSRLQEWRGRAEAATGGLWAAPAEAAAWERFAQANPPSTHPLFLLATGSPDTVFPAYGPPWHAMSEPGVATAHDFLGLDARLATASCVALFNPPNVAFVSNPQVAALAARLPHRTNPLFETYGCAP